MIHHSCESGFLNTGLFLVWCFFASVSRHLPPPWAKVTFFHGQCNSWAWETPNKITVIIIHVPRLPFGVDVLCCPTDGYKGTILVRTTTYSFSICVLGPVIDATRGIVCFRCMTIRNANLVSKRTSVSFFGFTPPRKEQCFISSTPRPGLEYGWTTNRWVEEMHDRKEVKNNLFTCNFEQTPNLIRPTNTTVSRICSELCAICDTTKIHFRRMNSDTE